MSIQEQITRIKKNVSDAYDAISERNGIIPENKNISNLANAIDSISPKLGTKTIEPSTTTKTYNSSDDNLDGYSSIIVNPVTSSVDSNIVPENIKNGISILGVDGIASIGSVGYKTINANGYYDTCDSSNVGHSTLNVCVPSSQQISNIYIHAFGDNFYNKEITLKTYTDSNTFNEHTIQLDETGYAMFSGYNFGKIEIIIDDIIISKNIMSNNYYIYIVSNPDTYYDDYTILGSLIDVDVSKMSSIDDLISVSENCLLLWNNEKAFHYIMATYEYNNNSSIVTALLKNTKCVEYMGTFTYGKIFLITHMIDIVQKLTIYGTINTLDSVATHIPTMTSNNTPEGSIIYSSTLYGNSSNSYAACKAFDKNTSTFAMDYTSNSNATYELGYNFTKVVYPYKCIYTGTPTARYFNNFYVLGKNSSNTFCKLSNIINTNINGITSSFILNDTMACTSIKISSTNDYFRCAELDFYCISLN